MAVNLINFLAQLLRRARCESGVKRSALVMLGNEALLNEMAKLRAIGYCYDCLTEKTIALGEQSAVKKRITQTPSVWKEIFIQGVWKTTLLLCNWGSSALKLFRVRRQMP